MQTPYAPPSPDYDKPHTAMPAIALFSPSNVLAKSRGSLLFVAICLLFIALVSVAGSVVYVESTLVFEGSPRLAFVAGNGIVVAQVTYLAILILRYRYQISRTLRQPSEQNFVLALQRFGLIWRTLGIVMLLCALVVGLAFAVGIIASVAWSISHLHR